MTTLARQSDKILGIILFFIFLAGCIYSYLLGDLFRFTDEQEYYIIAQNIVRKGFFTINGSDPSAWRPPGYSLFLSLFLFFKSNIFVLRLINFALLNLSLFLVYKILEKQSKITALIGVILMSLYPLFFFTASTLYPQTFAMALFLLTLYLLLDRPLTYTSALLVGILYGILTLTIVTFLGSLLITLFWLLWKDKKAWKKALVMFAATIAVLTPWTVRNALVFKSFVFVANNGGIAFVLGNSPETTPNAGGNIPLPTFDKNKVKTEVEINRFYQSTALKYIKENKLQSLKMYFLKFLNNFNYTNTLMTKDQMSQKRDLILFITYYTLLIISILSLFFFKPRISSDFGYLVMLYIGQGLLLALFITRIRYRLPFDPLLALISAPFVSKLIY